MKAILFLVSLLAALPLTSGEITVFAAASLTDSLKEIGAAYEKETGDTVRFNFAASNTLAQQIQAGAPADLFFSADEAKMDALNKAGFIDTASRKDLLGNSLVVITSPRGLKIAGIADLKNAAIADLKNAAIRHFSIGDPQAVPAGVYAKQWLEKVKLWETLEPKIVPAENVRSALAVVESGNAEAGIVYKTDAAISKKITVAFEIAPADGPKITYPAAVVKTSRHAGTARKFLAYLSGQRAGDVFTKFGFSVMK